MRLASALLLLALVPLAAAQAQPYMLHMQGHTYEYLPPVLEVAAGATVFAMNFPAPEPNATNEPHTVTSATDRSLFDVQNIQPTGEAYPFRAPSVPGEYAFYCIYHGDAQGNGMAGTLVVTEAAAPTPTPSPTERAESPLGGLALLAVALVLAVALRR